MGFLDGLELTAVVGLFVRVRIVVCKIPDM